MGRLMGRATAAAFVVALFLWATPSHQVKQIDVGVVLDMESFVGKSCWLCLNMALEDFYAANSNYTTRIVLHERDSGNDPVGAASAALDLLKNVHVQAILGPLRSAHASFIIDLGNKMQVPIVSFTVTSPSLSPVQTPYFIRSTQSSLYQVKAICSIVKKFGWRRVVPIYENTEYGHGFVPHLIDELQNVDARVPNRSVIPPSATEAQITSELYRLMTMQTRVFVLHMLPPLSISLLTKAREIGMMSNRYVWITTEALTEISDVMEYASMEGMLGLRTFIPNTSRLANFESRWRERYIKQTPNAVEKTPSIYGIWAYDTAWAMAKAIEKVGADDLSFKPLDKSDESSHSNVLAKLEISENGPRLRQAILTTSFKGIAGEFVLVDGQLKSSPFEIVNLIQDAWKVVGFWDPSQGIFEPFTNNTIIWPGGSQDVPKGWELPTNGRRLKVGVPVKDGFLEFVNTKGPGDPTGYCIDVFKAVLAQLPYNVGYEFVPFHFSQSNGSYNDLIDQIVFESFEAVVGDVTIIANRSQFVDFSLPYSETGVSMVVPLKENQDNNAWIFVKPLTKELWLASIGFFFFTGFVIWLVEHRINLEFRGTPVQQIGTIFYFAFSTLVFAHKETLQSNLSKVVLIMWVFVVLILTSSYTASLTAMLTVERFKPTVTHIQEILNNEGNIGYQDGSFVMDLLEEMGFDQSRLKSYSSLEEYEGALSNGTGNDGTAAIVDEIPVIKLFLKDRCSKYTMVGQTYKTNGFGFVFPKGSPLVPDISRAVLNVTQGKIMLDIEKRWFGDHVPCSVESQVFVSNRLHLSSLWGLFLITGLVSVLALLIFSCEFLYNNLSRMKASVASETTMWKKLVVSMRHYDQKDYSAHTFRKNNEFINPISPSTMSANNMSTMTPNTEGSQSPWTTSDESIRNRGLVDENGSWSDSPGPIVQD